MKLGILGGGQLGRMLALAALPLDIRCRVLDPSDHPCAAAVAEHVAGEYDDSAALGRFLNGLDAVTYEFENVPVETARWLAERLPVYPHPDALAVAQERLAEKEFFRQLGIPTPGFAAVTTRAELDTALGALGWPAVLKTRRFGYDGKGQAVLRNQDDLDQAWSRLGGRPLILEAFVPFERELSLIAVRGRDGAVQCYPLVQNRHEDGTLRETLAPAPDCPAELQQAAERCMRAALVALDYVGVLAIEFFQCGGELLANEMAPRVHNSGHWTIEGAETSQFENHIRAVLGLPLGSPTPRGCSMMLNLLGSWPLLEHLLVTPGCHVHLYGKSARPGRKVGHVTLCGHDQQELQSRAQQIDLQK